MSDITRKISIIRDESEYSKKYANSDFKLSIFKNLAWLSFITQEKKNEISRIKLNSRTNSLKEKMIKNVTVDKMKQKNKELFNFIFPRFPKKNKKLCLFDKFTFVFVEFVSCLMEVEKMKLLPKAKKNLKKKEIIEKNTREKQIRLSFFYSQLIKKYCKIFQNQPLKEIIFFEGLIYITSHICTLQYKNKEGIQTEQGEMELVAKDIIHSEVMRLFKTKFFVSELNFKNYKNKKSRNSISGLTRNEKINNTESYKSPLIQVLCCKKKNVMCTLRNDMDIKEHYSEFFQKNKGLIKNSVKLKRGKMVNRIVNCLTQEENNINNLIKKCQKLGSKLK